MQSLRKFLTGFSALKLFMRTSTRRVIRMRNSARPRLPRPLPIFSLALHTNTQSKLWRPSSGMTVYTSFSKNTPNPSSKRDITPARIAEITVQTVRPPTNQSLHKTPSKGHQTLLDTLLPYLTGILCPQCKRSPSMRKSMMRLNSSTSKMATAAMNLMALTRKRRSRNPPPIPLQQGGAARVLSMSRCALMMRSRLSSAGRLISSWRLLI